VKISKLQFVVHGTSNERSVQDIFMNGFRFTPGRPTVSTNLIHADDWTTNTQKQAQSLGVGTVAGEVGRVLVMKTPAGFHLGYGVFTEAFIDRAIMRVGGTPLRYAAGRKQLAWYQSADVEADRERIEMEIMNGNGWTDGPAYVVDPSDILGSFRHSPVFGSILADIQAAVGDLSALDVEVLSGYLVSELEVQGERSTEEIRQAVHELVVGTVESLVISRLRMMRWQGLAGMGYGFYEGREALQTVHEIDQATQLNRISEFEHKLAASGLFTSELAWLKPYIERQLMVMKVELGGNPQA
jgi:hypothetical protein